MLALTIPHPDPETIERFLNNTLPPPECDVVDSHISDCRPCQEVAQRLVDALPERIDASVTDDTPPRIAGCKALGRLAPGGMGVVWRLHDRRLDRDLAVKVMKVSQSRNPVLVRRFLQEARICGRLSHPFIVPVHAVGRLADGRRYYTMKLVDGHELGELLRAAQDRLSLIHVFARVCQAVAFAHRQGIIHRDLKPRNIMVGEHGEVQVMDWGLAKRLEDDIDTGAASHDGPTGADDWLPATRFGDVLGTMGYMPPEQSLGRVDAIDRRSDVFGLGAILCEILTGAPPYAPAQRGCPSGEAIEASLVAARSRLRACGADPQLAALAERCLAFDPRQRPADGGEVADAVARYLNDVEERLQQERLDRETERIHAAEERKRLELKADWERNKRRLSCGLAVSALLAISLMAFAAIERQKAAAHRQEQDKRAGHALALADDHIEHEEYDAAAKELKEAKGLLELSDHQALKQTLLDRERSLALVRSLDDIRLHYAVWSNGAYNCRSAVDGYERLFARLDIDPIDDDREAVLPRLLQLRIRSRLVAAMDDWAWLHHREAWRAADPGDAREHRRRRERLLELARRLDPDPALRDALRNGKIWDAPEELIPFAERLDPRATSPELLVLIGKLLPLAASEPYLRRCLVCHPRDFWMQVNLASLLMRRATEPIEASHPIEHDCPLVKCYAAAEPPPPGSRRLAQEAAGHLHAALALRKEAPGVMLDLIAALRLAGQDEGALAYSRHMLENDPDSSDARNQLGLAWLAANDLPQAEAAFRRALEANPASSLTLWNLVETLRRQERLAEARPYVEALLQDEIIQEDWRERLRALLQDIASQACGT